MEDDDKGQTAQSLDRTMNQPLPRFPVPESAAQLSRSTQNMLSSLGFCFGSTANDAETLAILARRGFEDGTAICRDRDQQTKQKRGSGEKKAAAVAAAASAAACLLASAASGDAENDFRKEELEEMFYLALRAEKISKTTTHPRAERDSREGQDFALAKWKKVMLLLHRCLAIALSRNVVLLADNDKFAAEVRCIGLELKDTKNLVSSLLAGQKIPRVLETEDTAATPAHDVLLSGRDQLATEVRRTELDLDDTDNLVSSLLNGQGPRGGGLAAGAAMRAYAAIPADEKYLLAGDLRRTELELEDTKNLVSSLLAGQPSDAGEGEMATYTPAQATVLVGKHQMVDVLRRTTLELEETKELVSSILAGQTQNIEGYSAKMTGRAHVHVSDSLSRPVSGSTAGGDGDESGHEHYSMHNRNPSDGPIGACSSNLRGSTSASDSSSGSGNDNWDGRAGVLGTIAEVSKESSGSSASVLTNGSGAASDLPVLVGTTPRSSDSSGGHSNLPISLDSTCDPSCGPPSGFYGASRLAATSPVLGMEMSYPLPGNTESASLSMVRSRDRGPAITSRRQQVLQAGPIPHLQSLSSARVAVWNGFAPPQSSAAPLVHSNTTVGHGAGGKSREGTQSISTTGVEPVTAASAASGVVARATSGLEIPVSLVKSIDDCSATAGDILCSSRAKDPIHLLARNSCPPPLASSGTVPPTPSAMEPTSAEMQSFELEKACAPDMQQTASSSSPIYADCGACLGDESSLRRFSVRHGHRREGERVASASTVLKELDIVRTGIKQDTSAQISALKTEQMAAAVAEQRFSAATLRKAPYSERQKTMRAAVADRPTFSALGGRRGTTRLSTGAKDYKIAKSKLTRIDLPLPLSRLEANAGRGVIQKGADKKASNLIAIRPSRRRASQAMLIGTERVGEIRVAREIRDIQGRGS